MGEQRDLQEIESKPVEDKPLIGQISFDEIMSELRLS